ncbi:MAG TPA: TetR family transcriptional regulator [Acidimicrobiia bacterium]|jgi:AcrR family transcriptional regulator
MTEPEPPPTEGLRERHRRRTEALLEEAALRLFEARGFDLVTVDDIAAAADVSRRTFFRYFATKEDVVLADQPRRLEELREALAVRPPDEPALTALRQALLSLAGGHEQDRERLLRRAKLMRATPSLQIRFMGAQRTWEQAVTEMVADRLGVDPLVDLRPGVIAASALASLRTAVSLWVTADGKGDLQAMVTEALDLLDGGLQEGVLRPRRPAAPPRR